MAIVVNTKGVKHAKSLIEAGKINHGAWERPNDPPEDDCIATDTDAKEGTEARKKYPVIKGDEIYVKAVASAITYAKNNGEDDVAKAAQELSDLIKEKEDKKGDGKQASLMPKNVFMRSTSHMQMAQVTKDSYKQEDHSIQATLATDKGVDEYDFDNWTDWNSPPPMKKRYIVISGMKTHGDRPQVPFLDSHMLGLPTIKSVIGSVSGFDKMPHEMMGRINFTSTQDGQEAETKYREGHLTDVSVGYNDIELKTLQRGEKMQIGDKTIEGPADIALQSELMEVSAVPIGADQFTTATGAFQINPQFKQAMIEKGLAANASLEDTLRFFRQIFNPSAAGVGENGNQTQNPKGAKAMDPVQTQPTPEEIQAKANAAAEAKVQNIQKIYQMAEDYRQMVPNIEEMRTQALTDGISSSDFGVRVLEASTKHKQAPPLPNNPPASLKLREVMAPWRKRAAHYFMAQAAEKRGEHNAFQKWNGVYQDEMRKLTPEQIMDENVQALEIIDNAPISHAQKVRLASTLVGGADGGVYLLPTPLLAEVFVLVEQVGICRKYFRPIVLGQGNGNSLKLDGILTKPIAYWEQEGVNGVAADLVFGQGSLTVYKLFALSSWTRELDEDAAIAYLPLWTQFAAEAIYLKEDLAGFIGDGTAPYGSFTGMLNAAANVVTMDPGKVAFTDANADDFRAVRDAVKVAYRQGAQWFLAPDVISNLEGLKDLQGRYIYHPPAAGMPATLWNYPIAENEGIQALVQVSAAGKKFAIFGNPTVMLMGMKREIDVLVSREAVLQDNTGAISVNAFQADSTLVRMTERVGFQSVTPTTSRLAVLKTAAQ